MSGELGLTAKVPIPPTPFVDGEGRISHEWLYFLIALFNRTGGAPGISLKVLQDEVIVLQKQAASLFIEDAFAQQSDAPAFQAVNPFVAALMMDGEITPATVNPFLAALMADGDPTPVVSQAPVPLTSAATITPDFSVGPNPNFSLALANNGTLAFPTNVRAGQSARLAITNGSGPFTLAINAGYKQGGGGPIVITPSAAALDILNLYAVSGSLISVLPQLNIS